VTKAYNRRVFCPHCRKSHPEESAFNQWVRGHPALDSRTYGIVRFDCDQLIHRYKIVGDGMGERVIQCVMFIEVKTHGAEPDAAQLDTLGLLSQVIRNRKKNVHADKVGRHLGNHTPPAVAYSSILGKKVALRMFGGHLLQFEKNDPQDSAWIKWDRKGIDAGQLVGLLRFELDPNWKGGELRPIDHRRRYRSVRSLYGFCCGVCGDEFDEDVTHCPICDGHYPAGEAHDCQPTGAGSGGARTAGRATDDPPPQP
jgi:hypothetical protein